MLRTADEGADAPYVVVDRTAEMGRMTVVQVS